MGNARTRFLTLGLFLASLFIGSCSHKPQRTSSPPPWRIIPETTIKHQRKQFFIYGKNLDHAELKTSASLTLEKGLVSNAGHVLEVFLIADTLAAQQNEIRELPGRRNIQVKTLDTLVNLPIRILQEVE